MVKKPVNILQKQTKAVRVLFLLSYVVFVYLLILYAIQDDLIFHPDKTYVSPKELALTEFVETRFLTRDRTRVMTWYAKGDPNKPAILFFHGNAGQVARFASPLLFLVRNGYSVMMLEYRGFAGSPGKLTQENVFSDAAMAYDFLKGQGYPYVIAFGYSFGTAVATGLADRRPIDGLILMAPLESLDRFAAETPIPLASYVLKDVYPSDDYIRDIYVPTLIIHGKKDALIPYHHAERLYEASGSQNKRLILTEKDDHSSVFFSGENMPTIAKWLGN